MCLTNCASFNILVSLTLALNHSDMLHIFGIHLAGVDGTFACLQDPRLLMASKKLLETVILKDDTPEILKNHDRQCQFNRRFDSHSWDGRYQVTQRMIEQDEEELDQEDTPMAGIE